MSLSFLPSNPVFFPKTPFLPVRPHFLAHSSTASSLQKSNTNTKKDFAGAVFARKKANLAIFLLNFLKKYQKQQFLAAFGRFRGVGVVVSKIEVEEGGPTMFKGSVP